MKFVHSRSFHNQGSDGRCDSQSTEIGDILCFNDSCPCLCRSTSLSNHASVYTCASRAFVVHITEYQFNGVGPWTIGRHEEQRKAGRDHQPFTWKPSQEIDLLDNSPSQSSTRLCLQDRFAKPISSSLQKSNLASRPHLVDREYV